jgi:hypothetical protein
MLFGVKCKIPASKSLSARKVELKCKKNTSEKNKHITIYKISDSHARGCTSEVKHN